MCDSENYSALEKDSEDKVNMPSQGTLDLRICIDLSIKKFSNYDKTILGGISGWSKESNWETDEEKLEGHKNNVVTILGVQCNVLKWIEHRVN